MSLLRTTVTAALALALTAAAGCAGAPAPAPAPEAAAPASRTIETAKGPVEVPGDPQRIVVLSGGLAGYAYALDAPVVATDIRVLGAPPDASGFPAAWSAQAVEQGTTALPGGDALNIEAVAAAAPDLIVGGGQGITAVQADQVYDQLTAIAPTVLVPTTATAWQDQLQAVADAIGRDDRVAALRQQYTDKVEQVRSSITVPDGAAVFILSLPGGKHYLVPQTAALPALSEEVGFTPDDVLAKAGNPALFGSGDSFEVSPELLGAAADAPTAFVVELGGPTLDQLAADPLYSALPAFQAGNVHALPATSYRPDLTGALGTLDAISAEFS